MLPYISSQQYAVHRILKQSIRNILIRFKYLFSSVCVPGIGEALTDNLLIYNLQFTIYNWRT